MNPFVAAPSLISIKLRLIFFWVNIIKCTLLNTEDELLADHWNHSNNKRKKSSDERIFDIRKRRFIQSYAIFGYYYVFFQELRFDAYASMNYCNYKYIHFIIYCTNYSKWNKWTSSGNAEREREIEQKEARESMCIWYLLLLAKAKEFDGQIMASNIHWYNKWKTNLWCWKIYGRKMVLQLRSRFAMYLFA